MFERFPERARQIVVLAQDEARTLRHNYIGTEHILLGLARENGGVAARILYDLGATSRRIAECLVAMLSARPKDADAYVRSFDAGEPKGAGVRISIRAFTALRRKRSAR